MAENKLFYMGDVAYDTNTYLDLARRGQDNYLNYLRKNGLPEELVQQVGRKIITRGNIIGSTDNYKMGPMGNMQNVEDIGSDGKNIYKVRHKQRGIDLKVYHDANALAEHYLSGVAARMPQATAAKTPAPVSQVDASAANQDYINRVGAAEAANRKKLEEEAKKKAEEEEAKRKEQEIKDDEAARTLAIDDVINGLGTFNRSKAGIAQNWFIGKDGTMSDLGALDKDFVEGKLEVAGKKAGHNGNLWGFDRTDTAKYLNSKEFKAKYYAPWALYKAYQNGLLELDPESPWAKAFQGLNIFVAPGTHEAVSTLFDELSVGKVVDTLYLKALDNDFIDDDGISLFEKQGFGDILSVKMNSGANDTLAIGNSFIMPGLLSNIGKNGKNWVWVYNADGSVEKVGVGELITSARDTGDKELAKTLIKTVAKNTGKDPDWMFGKAVSKDQQTVSPNAAFRAENGGVIKAQQGATLNLFLESRAPLRLSNDYKTYDQRVAEKAEANGVPESTQRAQDRYISKGAGNVSEPNGEFTALEWTRLGTAVADLASAGLAYAPGVGTAASAITGVGSTLTNFVADIADDGTTAGQTASNLALGLGLDLMGLIPGGGLAAKGSKIIKSLAKTAPKIIAAIGLVGAAPDQIAATKKAFSGEDMTSQDWRNFLGALTTLTGGTGAALRHRKTKASVQKMDDTVGIDVTDSSGTKKTLVFTGEDAKKIRKTAEEGGNMQETLNDLYSGNDVYKLVPGEVSHSWSFKRNVGADGNKGAIYNPMSYRHENKADYVLHDFQRQSDSLFGKGPTEIVTDSTLPTHSGTQELTDIRNKQEAFRKNFKNAEKVNKKRSNSIEDLNDSLNSKRKFVEDEVKSKSQLKGLSDDIKTKTSEHRQAISNARNAATELQNFKNKFTFNSNTSLQANLNLALHDFDIAKQKGLKVQDARKKLQDLTEKFNNPKLRKNKPTKRDIKNAETALAVAKDDLKNYIDTFKSKNIRMSELKNARNNYNALQSKLQDANTKVIEIGSKKRQAKKELKSKTDLYNFNFSNPKRKENASWYVREKRQLDRRQNLAHSADYNNIMNSDLYKINIGGKEFNFAPKITRADNNGNNFDMDFSKGFNTSKNYGIYKQGGTFTINRSKMTSYINKYGKY